MIIIEETRKTRRGTNTYLLCISKVPHDGGLVKIFKEGEIYSWQGGYHFGDPVYFFTVNGEWRYYGTEKVKWMADTMQEVWLQLSAAVYDKRVKWEEVDATNEMIHKQLMVKSQRLIPYGELPPNDFERMSNSN